MYVDDLAFENASISELETKIEAGDRDAMAYYLTQAVEHNCENRELKRRFRFVLKAEHGFDSSIVRNLGIVASKAGLEIEALSFAEDLIASDQLTDAYFVVKVLVSSKNTKMSNSANDLLHQLRARSHFRTRLFMAKMQCDTMGILGKWLFVPWRIGLTFRAALVYLRNPNDPRVKA